MLIITQALQFVPRTSAVARVLSCRRCIFSSSIIPQILSDENLCIRFLVGEKPWRWLKIFVLCDTMQFASFMFISASIDFIDYLVDVLLPLLLRRRYFQTTLRSCVVQRADNKHAEYVMKALCNIPSLSSLKIGGQISSSFPALNLFGTSLESLALYQAGSVTSAFSNSRNT